VVSGLHFPILTYEAVFAVTSEAVLSARAAQAGLLKMLFVGWEQDTVWSLYGKLQGIEVFALRDSVQGLGSRVLLAVGESFQAGKVRPAVYIHRVAIAGRLLQLETSDAVNTLDLEMIALVEDVENHNIDEYAQH